MNITVWKAWQMSKEDDLTAKALVFLKSRSGLSLAKAETKQIISENIKQYFPRDETVAKAVQELEKLGFTILGPIQRNATKITITGKPELFESIFNVKLIVEKRESTLQSREGIVIRSDEKLTIPDYLKDTIDEVSIISERVEYFEQK